MLRWLNRYRASSGERRLARQVARLESALDEARAEAEARARAAEGRATLAEQAADAKQEELKVLTASNERIRALYEADTAEAARRIAGKGD